MATIAHHESPAVVPPCPRTRRYWLIGTAILIVAAVLRIAGAYNDLWLDELWSIYLAKPLQSSLQVFTGIHHDNNHYLNTLWIWEVGPDGHWYEYRAVSILAGLGTVVVAGLIGARRDAATGFLAMLIFTVSYVMVLYSSEARGYGIMAFCAILGYYSLEKFFARPAYTSAAIYIVCVVLGLLAQLIFIGFLAAGMVASFYWITQPTLDRFIDWILAQWQRTTTAVDDGRSHVDSRQSVKGKRFRSLLVALSLVVMHGVPLLVLLGLYYVDIRQLTIGGGTLNKSLPKEYASALAWALGTPLTGIPLAAGALAAVALFYGGLKFVFRQSREQAVFFFCVILFPFGLVLVGRYYAIYIRYFLLSIEFLLLLMSFWLGALSSSSLRWKRSAAVAILLAFCALNGVHLATLLRYGRGDTSGVSVLWPKELMET